jgi:pilus assembly protein FimV
VFEDSKQEPASLDFDLGFSAPSSSNESTIVLDVPLAAPNVMDFDLGSDDGVNYQNTVVLGAPLNKDEASLTSFDVTADLQNKQTIHFDSTSELNSVFDKTRDFDTTLSTSEPEAASPAELAEMLFDVTASRPAEPEATPQVADDGGLDFALDFPMVEPVAVVKPVPSVFGDITLNLDDDKPSDKFSPAIEVSGEVWQEVATKLDLAKAYQEMGDGEGAQEILQEVLREGDEQQRATAQQILQQLSA